MIINADSLLPHIKAKVRPQHSDASRHIICPHCERRTKLNTLGDGRKKCTVCMRKFRIHKATDANKLRQCAEILLCFCLDFSANQTTQITHHRYRLVAVFYEQFRKLLAQTCLSPEKLLLLEEHGGDIRTLKDASRCRWCKRKIRSDDAAERPPVFGVRVKAEGEVVIDPLNDDEAIEHFHTFGDGEIPKGRNVYAGFICCGTFHPFTRSEQLQADADRLWTWIRDRVRTHHGIWKRNTGYYLKELEWKYNNKDFHPHLQARKLIDLMPMNFITDALSKTKAK